MPYIKQKERERIINNIRLLGIIQTEGELNYLITILCDDFIETHKGLSYKNINTIIGVLECVKQEFYRKVAAPYENKKRFLNGKVSIYDIGD